LRRRISSSVTTIGERAFYGCSSLTSITIPSSVTTIGEHAFNGCSSLTSITIPSSVTSIGNYAFVYCSGLTSITIPSSVTTIGECAFYDCSSLTSITIPSSVTTIGRNAFPYECDVVIACDSTLEVEENEWGGNVTKVSHMPGTAVQEDIVEPTCESDGSHNDVVYCTVCNQKLSTTHVIDDPSTGHDYVSTITKQSTKTEKGVRTWTCSVCEDTYTEDMELLPDDGIPYFSDDSDLRGFDSFVDVIESGATGELEIVMNGATTVPASLFEAAKGNDVTLIFEMDNGVKWTVNGKDITGTNLKDINLSVTKGPDAGKTIPVDVINEITGEKSSVNLSLAYDGEFGFKAVLTVNLEAKNNGYYANLFYYNPSTKKLEYVCASKIDAAGNTNLTFTHASDYTIVISDKDMKDAGNKVPEPTVTPNNSTPTTTSPQTGDEAPIVWLIAIMMISACGIVVMRKKNIK